MSEIRKAALEDAAKDVCALCGGRAFPDDADSHILHGPNAAGNYYHKPVYGPRLQLCAASAIWSRIHFEGKL